MHLFDLKKQNIPEMATPGRAIFTPEMGLTYQQQGNQSVECERVGVDRTSKIAELRPGEKVQRRRPRNPPPLYPLIREQKPWTLDDSFIENKFSP